SIRGAGTDVIRIEGRQPLSPAVYAVIPDRIEAATLLAAGIITCGSVRVTDVIPTHLESTLSKFGELGAEIEVGADYVDVSMRSPIRAC
ncbi:MAG TPA: UDP-N-acetylglucosamine 1-carboxyvinyltransferase, partial [Firmicutes bacterium]|nr:UDP-N-acetylglucosamine 1-carboxyvinyltransferase [Bacillota bacterium]